VDGCADEESNLVTIAGTTSVDAISVSENAETSRG
jgi:hypothetical protein